MKQTLLQVATALWFHIRTLLQLAHTLVQRWRVSRHRQQFCEETGKGLASRNVGEPTILEQLAATNERIANLEAAGSSVRNARAEQRGLRIRLTLEILASNAAALTESELSTLRSLEDQRQGLSQRVAELKASLWPALLVARLSVAAFWGAALFCVVVCCWPVGNETEDRFFPSTSDEELTGWQPATVVPPPEPLSELRPKPPAIDSKLIARKQKTLDYWNRMIQIGNELNRGQPQSSEQMQKSLRGCSAAIKRMPMLNVDPQAVQLGLTTASLFTRMADHAKFQQSPALMLESLMRGLNGDPFGASQELQQKHRALGQELQQLQETVVRVRAELTERYQVEFSSF